MNSLLWVDDADLTDLVPLTEAREMDVAIGPLEEIVTELDLYCYTYADRSGWGRQLDRNLTARIEWSTRPGRWLEIHVFRETDRCGTCSRLCCSRCCHRSGSGQGQGSRRWAECWDCQRTRENAPTTRREKDRAAREDARRMARALNRDS